MKKIIHANGHTCGGEYTACGIAQEEIGDLLDEKNISNKPLEGINCKLCIDVIKFYRSKPDPFTNIYDE